MNDEVCEQPQEELCAKQSQRSKADLLSNWEMETKLLFTWF